MVQGLTILEKATIVIQDVVGREVKRTMSITTPICVDLAAEPNGIYILTIRTDRVLVSRKVIMDQ